MPIKIIIIIVSATLPCHLCLVLKILTRGSKCSSRLLWILNINQALGRMVECCLHPLVDNAVNEPSDMETFIPPVSGRRMPPPYPPPPQPRDVPVWSLKSDPLLFLGKKDWANVIKLRILRWRDYLGLSQWTHLSQRSLQVKEGGRGIEGGLCARGAQSTVIQCEKGSTDHCWLWRWILP